MSDNLNKAITNAKEIQESYRRYITSRNEHNDFLVRGFKAFANLGWYISEDINFGALNDLTSLAEAGSDEPIDAFFVAHYSTSLDKHFTKLRSRQQDRIHLINEAEKAHKEGMYHSSILLFITIADGICAGELFMIGKDKKRIKNFLKENDTPETLSKFLSVISEVNAIDAHTSQSDNYKSNLNRHGIIHGYDISYGSEINSLKALSLLTFVNDMVNRHKRRSY
jgi:hypothetical protein